MWVIVTEPAETPVTVAVLFCPHLSPLLIVATLSLLVVHSCLLPLLPVKLVVFPTATEFSSVIASVDVPPKTLSMMLVTTLLAISIFSPSSVEGAGVEGSAASVLAEPATASAVTTTVAPSATLSAATVYSPALGVSVVSPLVSASLTAAAPSVKPSAAFTVNFTSLSAGTTSSVATSLPL